VSGGPTSTIPWPSDFGKDLDGPAGWDNTGITFDPGSAEELLRDQHKETTDQYERRIFSELHMRERQAAAYVMANLEGEHWSGNLGLRFVQTHVNADIPTPIPAGACVRSAPGQPAIPCAAYPGAITDAGDLQQYYDDQATYPFNQQGRQHLLLRQDRQEVQQLAAEPEPPLRAVKDMIARFGASRTIGRQNYNILGAGLGTPTCDASGCHVTGPNPDLKPLTSDNLDAVVGLVLRRRSMVGVDVFYSKIDGYVKTGTTGGATIDLYDAATRIGQKTYAVNTSSQQGARIAGIELSYEQPFGNTGFGFTSNVSRAKTKVDDGRPMVGASEWAGNLGGYFENDTLSARLVANYRSEYVNSSTAPAPTANSQGLYVVNGVTDADRADHGFAGDDAGLQRQLQPDEEPGAVLRRDQPDQREARLLPLQRGRAAEAGRDRPPVLPEPEVQVLR
jgi:iron complex outermembrane receptor protein